MRWMFTRSAAPGIRSCGTYVERSMATAQLTLTFAFPTEPAAEGAAAQLCRGKAISARVEQAPGTWHVVAECDYPDWALPHLDSGCRAFASSLGGEFLGTAYGQSAPAS